MSLLVEIHHVAGDFRLDVAVRLGSGLTALVGPSGAGKTTFLDVVAGLVQPRHAVVQLGGDVLSDTGRGIRVPPHRRRIGYVFQEPRLFAHLTVRQNLMYGRWFHRHVTGGVTSDEVISLLNLQALLARRPSGLSGGEKQRVALGRVLLARPRLLLLDEPLASVDQQHRLEILPYLDRIRAEHRIPTVYVTHSELEVASRAEQVITLRAGQVA